MTEKPKFDTLEVKVAAHKQLLDAKIQEFTAYAMMDNRSGMNSARDEISAWVDIYCDTVMDMMVEFRRISLK